MQANKQKATTGEVIFALHNNVNKFLRSRASCMHGFGMLIWQFAAGGPIAANPSSTQCVSNWGLSGKCVMRAMYFYS